jgi:hypothetical protein
MERTDRNRLGPDRRRRAAAGPRRARGCQPRPSSVSAEPLDTSSPGGQYGRRCPCWPVRWCGAPGRRRTVRGGPRRPQSPYLGVAGSPNAAHHDGVRPKHDLYCVRIKGRLGATALSAFPAMVHHVDGRETVLTGLLEDRSAVFGVLAQVEALGLELIELRQIRPRRRSTGSGDDCSPDLS